MKEPSFYLPDVGELIPYSQAPSFMLLSIGDVTEPPAGQHPEHEHWDGDFRRRYAALILQSRGQ